MEHGEREALKVGKTTSWKPLSMTANSLFISYGV